MQEIHFLLIPSHKHKKVFQDIPVVGFCNGKSLNHLVQTKLPNVERKRKSESFGKRKYQVCRLICDTDTFLSKVYIETFNIQSG